MRLRRHSIRAGALLAPVLMLAACGDESADVEAEGNGLTASGEVLAPTVSDAMIPTDQLRSAAPRLREQPRSDTTGGDAEPGEDEGIAEADPGLETAPEVLAEPEDDQGEPAEQSTPVI